MDYKEPQGGKRVRGVDSSSLSGLSYQERRKRKSPVLN